MAMLLVMTNLPDRASAQALAAALVDEHLAACVNILSSCQSIYRWQGAVQTADEVPLLIKTCTARYAALEAAMNRPPRKPGYDTCDADACAEH